MLLFSIMAMAAIVIDIGFARLAQLQMQSAADSAAIEGLRSGNGAASEIVGLIFDDDLDTSSDHRQFGAGPVVDFTGDVDDPSLAASQDLSIPTNRSYKPTMQVGTSTPGLFRVKLQRGGDLDADANLFAVGPPVPYLFARGSFLSRELIRNGITVRAEAISRYEPVVCVGNAVAGLPGRLDLAVSINDWDSSVGSNLFVYAQPVIGFPIGNSQSSINTVPGFLAIFDPAANDRVIGFGLGSVSGGVIVKAPLSNGIQVAPANVSAAFAYPATMGDDVALVFQQRMTHRNALAQAPVSVRN